MPSWSRIIREAPLLRAECQVPLRRLQAVEAAPEPAAPEAEVFLARARQEAEGIRQAAQEEARRLRQQAWEEGYRAGLEEGRQAALAAAAAEAARFREEAEGLRRQAHEVLQEARKAYQKTLEEAEAQILELAVEIATKIIGRQIELAPEVILDIARGAIHQVAEGEFYTIYAAPQDADLLRQHREELLKEASPNARLQIIADGGLKPGGCRVETENGFVDATIDTQLQAVRNILRTGGKG